MKSVPSIVHRRCFPFKVAFRLFFAERTSPFAHRNHLFYYCRQLLLPPVFSSHHMLNQMYRVYPLPTLSADSASFDQPSISSVTSTSPQPYDWHCKIASNHGSFFTNKSFSSITRCVTKTGMCWSSQTNARSLFRSSKLLAKSSKILVSPPLLLMTTANEPA